MYWYISFLRPPPISAEAGSSITITPQVANDLRTEIRFETTEIHFNWQRCEPFLQAPLPAQHLTSFTPPESTYRAISISIPDFANVGDKWRLCLFSPSKHTPLRNSSNDSPTDPYHQDILALSGPSSGCLPLSVFSEGIEITRPIVVSGGITRGVGATGGKSKGKKVDTKGKGKEKDDVVKQTRIMREWETPNGQLRLVEQTSFDLDKKIWDSGLALSSWLYRHLLLSECTKSDDDTHEILNLLRSTDKPLNILELGSGTGLVSIALNSILSQISPGGLGRITATDLGSAIELMKENMEINQPRRNGEETRKAMELRADVLDWDEPLPPWITDISGESNRWPDLIIAADVTYNTASFPSLVRTLKSLLQPSSIPARPKLLLAYKQRDPGERDLWDMLEKEGVKMALAEELVGAQEGEGLVELWIGHSMSG